MVGDLSGIVAEADAVVVDGRAEPDREAVGAGLERLPEPHVMAPPRADAGGLLEREILPAALV